MAARPKAPRFGFVVAADAEAKTAETEVQVTPEAEAVPVPAVLLLPDTLLPEKSADEFGAQVSNRAKARSAPVVSSAELPAPLRPAPLPEPVVPTPVPSAPTREERRAFSTRLRPTLKRSLDAFVMELKMAGWPVSQEVVLESLVRRLRDDDALRAAVTAELTGPTRDG